MKLKTTLFAAAATIVIAPAAHAYDGWYGAIGAGLSVTEDDIDFEATSGPLLFDQNIDYDPGIGVYTAIGRTLGEDYRLEFEFAFRRNDARHIPGDGINFSGWSDVDGDVNVQTFMLNLIRDFDTGEFLTPYLGLGVGFARVKGELSGNNPGGANGITDININDRYLAIAGQGVAGVAVDLAEGLVLDLSYRYLLSDERAFDGSVNFAPASFQTNYAGHSAFAGLRWNFGASAPAAPAVQYKDCWDGSSVPTTAECPPQLVEQQSAIAEPIQFTVYFDYDKSNLTPEASSLVREAAARAQQFDIETVVVTGNTDTSGGAAYNQRLSERRAAIVRDALIANGVSADRIRMDARGETNLAKPTADGVREPLNRRTDVVISFE